MNRILVQRVVWLVFVVGVCSVVTGLTEPPADGVTSRDRSWVDESLLRDVAVKDLNWQPANRLQFESNGWTLRLQRAHSSGGVVRGERTGACNVVFVVSSDDPVALQSENVEIIVLEAADERGNPIEMKGLKPLTPEEAKKVPRFYQRSDPRLGGAMAYAEGLTHMVQGFSRFRGVARVVSANAVKPVVLDVQQQRPIEVTPNLAARLLSITADNHGSCWVKLAWVVDHGGAGFNRDVHPGIARVEALNAEENPIGRIEALFETESKQLENATIWFNTWRCDGVALADVASIRVTFVTEPTQIVFPFDVRNMPLVEGGIRASENDHPDEAVPDFVHEEDGYGIHMSNVTVSSDSTYLPALNWQTRILIGSENPGDGSMMMCRYRQAPMITSAVDETGRELVLQLGDSSADRSARLTPWKNWAPRRDVDNRSTWEWKLVGPPPRRIVTLRGNFDVQTKMPDDSELIDLREEGERELRPGLRATSKRSDWSGNISYEVKLQLDMDVFSIPEGSELPIVAVIARDKDGKVLREQPGLRLGYKASVATQELTVQATRPFGTYPGEPAFLEVVFSQKVDDRTIEFEFENIPIQ